MKKKSKFIAVNAALAAIYFILTLINPVSFGSIQFRISTILITIPFFKRDLRFGMYAGVFLSNLFSPLGFIDVICGLAIELILYEAVILVFKNNYLRALFYSIFAGLIVGFELTIIYKLPFMLNVISIFLSSLALSSIGVFVFEEYGRMIFKNLDLLGDEIND